MTTHHQHQQHTHSTAKGLAVDPVCGMRIDQIDDFVIQIHRQETYYFCSEHCRDKFSSSPAVYMTGEAKPAATHLLQPSFDGETRYTCPMHPEIVQDEPGSCPKCGMALESMGVVPDQEEKNPEYDDMRHRLIFAAILTVPLVLIAMRDILPGGTLIERFASDNTLGWLELILSTPVVLWAGGPFYVRAVQSVSIEASICSP